jgi:hypothetical protein
VRKEKDACSFAPPDLQVSKHQHSACPFLY